MAQALEVGREIHRQRLEEAEKRKQELLRWRAEEEDRENLAKARKVSLQPASESVTLKPASESVSPITAPGEVPNPATPPEALQVPISEEEASYRKELSERLAKLSDEVPEPEKKERPEE